MIAPAIPGKLFYTLEQFLEKSNLWTSARIDESSLLYLMGIMSREDQWALGQSQPGQFATFTFATFANVTSLVACHLTQSS